MVAATLGFLGEATQDTASRSHISYGEDLHGWALEQAALIKAGRFSELDIVNLAEEVSDLAQRDYEAWESDLSRVIQHILKWEHQPDRRSRSWASTIKEHRRRVSRRMAQSPSLKGRRDEALSEAYERGRAEALGETDLPDALLPLVNPYSWDEIMNRPIEWPEP